MREKPGFRPHIEPQEAGACLARACFCGVCVPRPDPASRANGKEWSASPEQHERRNRTGGWQQLRCSSSAGPRLNKPGDVAGSGIIRRYPRSRWLANRPPTTYIRIPYLPSLALPTTCCGKLSAHALLRAELVWIRLVNWRRCAQSNKLHLAVERLTLSNEKSQRPHSCSSGRSWASSCMASSWPDSCLHSSWVTGGLERAETSNEATAVPSYSIREVGQRRMHGHLSMGKLLGSR
ncbi:hypothetical protein N656DRAFT_592647 [Canariomyces notabilis]|uniref:Uncharacterized protein n=1 Tax=Canariomyces notabilis TaxID=2074819 RepID=A0AAN6TFY0_9PEZI|nr:hypothetical protein N656DRAFT_592647 [Canariomyces arenarius]